MQNKCRMYSHVGWTLQLSNLEILASSSKRANMTTHASMNAYMVCSFVCLMCTRVQASGHMPCARCNRKPRHSGHRRPNDQGHRCHCEKRQNYTPCHAPKKCATIKTQTCTWHQWALFMSAFKYTLNASWAAAWLTGNTLEPECVESYSIHISAPNWYFVPIEWN